MKKQDYLIQLVIKSSRQSQIRNAEQQGIENRNRYKRHQHSVYSTTFLVFVELCIYLKNRVFFNLVYDHIVFACENYSGLFPRIEVEKRLDYQAVTIILE